MTVNHALPQALIEHGRAHSRIETIQQHAVEVKVEWWNDKERMNLRRGPVVATEALVGNPTGAVAALVRELPRHPQGPLHVAWPEAVLLRPPPAM